MNESITTPYCAWRVMQPLHRIEADKVSKREGINTMLESEQHIMWIYYYQSQSGSYMALAVCISCHSCGDQVSEKKSAI
jgi:hypothetical protein